MPVQFTTDLPDAAGLSLDASVQSEMTASWGDTINNGEYRIEWKEEEPDSETSYSSTNSATVGEATTAYTIADLLDGEKYSVRIRTQTAHKTGTWLEAADVTKLTAADKPMSPSTTSTSIDLSWTRNSDFEGSQPIYRKRTDYEYESGDLGRLVGTAPASATSFTDDSAQPDREYTYVVRELTQWVHADSPVSDPVTADSIGLEDRAVPPRGWYAEIDHPSGTTISPQILDDPVRRPTVNGFPRVELPVPQDETWHATAFDDAPLSVWHDGDREPIEQLEHRRLRPDRTVLEGRGGTQLDRRVIEDVDVQPTHEFAQDLIQQYTDYTANVDNPDSSQEQRVLQAADTDVELQQALTSIPSDSPLYISNGRLQIYQTCHFREGENYDGATGTSTVSDSEASDGSAQQLASTGDMLTFTFETGYDVSSALVHFRRRPVVDRNNGAFEIRVDGNVLFSGGEGGMTAGYGWQDFDAGSLSAGTHTLEIELTTSGTDKEINVDAVALEDSAYNHAFDNSVGTNGYLDGPRLYPHEEPVELTEIQTPLGIAEATLSTDSTVAELALRTDGTGSYDAADDTASHTVTYSELSTAAQGRVALGYDPDATRDTASPRTGYQSYTLDSLELTAVLDDTPVLTNRSFDGKLIDVLREIASIGNFVFEVRQSGSDASLEWTQIDQRPTDVDPDLADYEIDRQTEDVVERAIVYGGAQRITRQTVDVTLDAWVDLPFPNARLVEGKETVYDGSTEFERGTDYEIRYVTADGQPQIQALSGGSFTDGQTVSVDADVKPRGEFMAGDVVDEDSAKTIVEDIPGLASKQMCDQVALYLVEETGDALTEAEVTVPHSSVKWSVIEAIDPEQLPTDGPMQVREINSTASETALRLASRQSVGEAVQEIRDRTQRNSERV